MSSDGDNQVAKRPRSQSPTPATVTPVTTSATTVPVRLPSLEEQIADVGRKIDDALAEMRAAEKSGDLPGRDFWRGQLTALQSEKTEQAKQRTLLLAAAAKKIVLDRSNIDVLEKMLDDLVATGKFKQPAPPSSLPLWWQLGEVNHCQSIIDAAADNKPYGLIGLSGSGKTRAMYELLTTRFGFFWTFGVESNGGARVVSSQFDMMPSEESGREGVYAKVDRLLTIYAVMFLAWRKAHPAGTPRDWLVFQTANLYLNRQLPEVAHGFIDSVVEKVCVHLSNISRDSVWFLLTEVKRVANVAMLLVVVDEAQILANKEGKFLSSVGESLRSPLSPVVKRLQEYGTSWWVAGTSLSLRNITEIAESNVAKGPTQFPFVLSIPAAFDTFEPFRQYITLHVSRLADEAFDDALWELFEMFRGRARPVARLVVALSTVVAAKRELTYNDVVDVGLTLRSELLDASLNDSFTANLIRKLDTRSYSVEGRASVLRDVLIALMRGNADEISNVMTMASRVEIFESAIGRIARPGDPPRMECREPLAQAALFVALCVNGVGVGALNPVLTELGSMSSWSDNASVVGFMAEGLVAPFIHHYLAANAAKLSHDIEAFHGNVIFSLRQFTDIATALNGEYKVFSPKSQAHPDWIHTIGNLGVLGQVKFRRSLSRAEWDHAVRTTSREALFRIDADPRSPITVGFEAEHNSAQAAMTKHWSKGYASYVFTLAEPPAGVEHRQVLVDGRVLLVFSPKLCPELFEFHPLIASDSDIARNMWSLLKRIKTPTHNSVSIAVASMEDFKAATLFSVDRAVRVVAFRDSLLAGGVAHNELWTRIVTRFWSLKDKGRPDWLVD